MQNKNHKFNAIQLQHLIKIAWISIELNYYIAKHQIFLSKKKKG